MNPMYTKHLDTHKKTPKKKKKALGQTPPFDKIVSAEYDQSCWSLWKKFPFKVFLRSITG